MYDERRLAAARTQAERDALRAVADRRERRTNRLIAAGVLAVTLAIVGAANYGAWYFGIPPYTNRHVQIDNCPVR